MWCKRPEEHSFAGWWCLTGRWAVFLVCNVRGDSGEFRHANIHLLREDRSVTAGKTVNMLHIPLTNCSCMSSET